MPLPVKLVLLLQFYTGSTKEYIGVAQKGDPETDDDYHTNDLTFSIRVRVRVRVTLEMHTHVSHAYNI